jgi:RNA polymerase sigma-70 factor, ECF subfamily
MSDFLPESNIISVSTLSEVRDKSPSGVDEAMVRLFDDVRVPLLRYLSAFPLNISDSEDVVQEAFLSLFQGLQKGNKHHNPRGWLFQAAHHLALKKRQRSRRDPESSGFIASVGALAIDPGLNPEDQLVFNQTQQRLLSVVRALPEQHRFCLYLRAEGLRYREIAEIVGMSLASVSLSLGRSLALIARAAQR